MLNAKTALAALVCTVALFATHDVNAFKLAPTGTDDERIVVNLKSRGWGKFEIAITEFLVGHFTSPVHEELTNRIWGCDPPAAASAKDKTCVTYKATPPALIYGVQWNDNPPFKLDATSSDVCTLNQPIRLPDRQPECWSLLFFDAASNAAKPNVYYRQTKAGDGKALIYRTHFGDLQFLHSMASWNGEKLGETKSHMLMWAEFTYKVAQGDIAPTTKLSAIAIDGFSGVLGKYWSDVRNLFTYGVTAYGDQIPDVAFGSLLHMVEDSFSESHTSREAPVGVCSAKSGGPKAGRILALNSYTSQDSKTHDMRDSRDWMIAGVRDNKGGDAVSVGRALKAMRDSKAPWADVREYLDKCVYEVSDDDLDNPAGPGDVVP